MKIVFWENIISPHQSFLLRELSFRHEVLLAVLKEISSDRVRQGWKRPDTGDAQIIVLNNQSIAYDLLDKNRNAIHLFSGIASYNILKDVFKKLDRDAITGVIVEAGSPLGWQRHFRKPLYTLKSLRYSKKIDFVFAMGDLGVDWYNSVGFSKNKLHKFQYFTELPNIDTLKERSIDNTPKLLFIGQLIDRKNIKGLLDALVNLKEMKWSLDIIGDGPLRERLKDLTIEAKLTDRVAFRGNMVNKEAMDLLSNSDYLILPSNFDGWGAVVNEALSRGVKVITNNNCGASCLVREMDWGIVYEDNSGSRLEAALTIALNNFKRESLFTRKRVATKFAANYSKTIVDKFEELLLSK